MTFRKFRRTPSQTGVIFKSDLNLNVNNSSQITPGVQFVEPLIQNINQKNISVKKHMNFSKKTHPGRRSSRIRPSQDRRTS